MSRLRLPLTFLLAENPRLLEGGDGGFRTIDERARWRLVKRFAVDPEVLAGNHWDEFLVGYQIEDNEESPAPFPDGTPRVWAALQAPDRGRFHLITKGSEHLFVFLPTHPEHLSFRAGGWYGPHANALVIRLPNLTERAARLQTTLYWVALHKWKNRRYLTVEEGAEGIRVQDAFRDVPSLHEFKAILRSDETANAAERVLLKWDTGVYEEVFFSPKGEIIYWFPLATAFSLGLVYIPPMENGEPDFSAPWYWFDSHEVFSRLFEEDAFGSVRPFHISGEGDPESRRPLLKGWYERENLLPSARIKWLALNNDFVLHNPPEESELIPREVLFMSASSILEAVTDDPGTTWSLRWTEETGAEIESPPPRLQQNVISTKFTFSSPDRTLPVMFRLIATTIDKIDVIRFLAFPGQLKAALDKAYEVEMEFKRFQSWLNQAYMPAPLADHEPVNHLSALELAHLQRNIIENIRYQQPGEDLETSLIRALRADDDDINSDRRSTILRRFGQSMSRLHAKQGELQQLYNQELFQEVVSRADPSATEAIDQITNAMKLTAKGTEDLHKKLVGFIDDRPLLGRIDPPKPILTAEVFMALWKRGRSLRSPLSSILGNLVEADVVARNFYLLRNLLWHPQDGPPSFLYPSRAETMARLEGLVDRYQTKLPVEDFAFPARRTIDPTTGEVRLIVREVVPNRRSWLSRQVTERGVRIGNRFFSALNTLALIYDAIAYYESPNTRNFSALASTTQNLVNTGLDIAIHRWQVQSVSRPAFQQTVDSLSRLKQASSAGGLVLSGISAYYQIADITESEHRGQTEREIALHVALGATIASIGLDYASLGVAVLFGTSIAAAPTIALLLAVVGIGAGVAAITYSTSELEDSFSHSLFGDAYSGLAPDNPGIEIFERIDTRNMRGDWYGNIDLQLAHFRQYFYPLNAEFYKAYLRPGVWMFSEFVLRATPQFAQQGSMVFFQLWNSGSTPYARIRASVAFILEPGRGQSIPLPSGLSGPLPPGLDGGGEHGEPLPAEVDVEFLSENSTQLTIKIPADESSNPSYEANRAMLAISLSRVSPSTLREEVTPTREEATATYRFMNLLQTYDFSATFLNLEDRT